MVLMSHCITVEMTGNVKICLSLLSVDLWTSYLLFKLIVISSFVDLSHLNNGVIDFSFCFRRNLKKEWDLKNEQINFLALRKADKVFRAFKAEILNNFYLKYLDNWIEIFFDLAWWSVAWIFLLYMQLKVRDWRRCLSNKPNRFYPNYQF